MRTLVVSTAELGVERVVHDVLAELAAGDDDEFHYLTRPGVPVPEGVSATRLLSEGLVDRVRDVEPAYLGYAIMGFWLRAYRQLARDHADYDAVWLHNPRLLPCCPAEIGEKTLVTYHNHLRGAKAEFHGGLARLYYRAFGAVERRGLWSLSGARFTGVARDVVAELRAEGVPPERVRYVGNGVDVDRFAPERAVDLDRARYPMLADAHHDPAFPHAPDGGEVEPGGTAGDADAPDDGPVRLLSLGSLTEQKRPLALLRFFEALCDRTDRELTLVVAGDGPRREAAERFVRQHGLTNAHLLGFVDEDQKPAIYASADAFVLASRYEGEPLALYEALASGLPALVSDIPVHRFVAEADCGRVLDFDAPRSAASAAAPYLERDTTDHAMNARTYATENLSWATRAREYRDELHLLGGRPC